MTLRHGHEKMNENVILQFYMSMNLINPLPTPRRDGAEVAPVPSTCWTQVRVQVGAPLFLVLCTNFTFLLRFQDGCSGFGFDTNPESPHPSRKRRKVILVQFARANCTVSTFPWS